MNKLMKFVKAEPENERLLMIIYLAFFNSGMMSILLGNLIPYIQGEYGLNYVQSGFFLSVNQIGNVCAIFLVGFLPYFIGKKKSAVILGSGMVVGLILITLTGNYVLLVLAFILMGISRGTMSNICNSSASELAGNKTRGINLLHALFAIGAFISPLLLLMGVKFLPLGWRTAPLIIAFLGLIIFISMARSNLSSEPVEKQEKGKEKFYKSWSFWINTGILFFYLCAESSIIGWFVTYFKDTGRLSGELAEITSSVVWIMVMVGRLTCATALSKVDKSCLTLLLGLLFMTFFGAILLTTSTNACFICLIGIGFSMAGIYPTTLASMKDTSSTVITGATLSTATLGAIIMPMVVGALAELKGINFGIAAVMGALIIMNVLIVIKIVSARKAA